MAASSSAERSTSFALPFLRIGGALPLPTFCNPAFSLSLSSHDKIVDKIESISNRFESARGAARNARRMLLTRRLFVSMSLGGEAGHTDQHYCQRMFCADVLELLLDVHCSPQLIVSSDTAYRRGQHTIMPELGNKLIAIPNLLF
jgi:hypothetical protein